jgi:hypothetical protein
MLRHIYLTHKYGNKLTEMQEDASRMAHSVSQQKDYILREPTASDPSPTKDVVGSGMNESNERINSFLESIVSSDS